MEISKCLDAVADVRRVYGGSVPYEVSLALNLAVVVLLIHKTKLQQAVSGSPREHLAQLAEALRECFGDLAVFDRLAARPVCSIGDVLGIIEGALDNLNFIRRALREEDDEQQTPLF